MNKILFFNPWATRYAKLIPNSVLQIAASVDGKYDWTIVDGNREREPLNKICNYLDSGEFKYFCSTVMPGPQLEQAIPFTKEIRRRYPKVQIIWGGYFASNQHHTVMKSGYVDYVVNGPGDKAFPLLIDALEKNRPCEDIQNLVFKNGSSVIKTAKAPLADQDTLPPLPYEKLNTFYPMAQYLGKTFLGKKTISYHSSIGCPFTCSFCGVVPIFEARWRGKSASNILKDILFLKRTYGGDAITFHDNNFFVSEKRAVEFAQLIRTEEMNWWGEGRIDTVDKYSDESLRALRASGCRMIFFGAESGNDALLKQMDKGGTQSGEKIKLFAARLKDFNIIPEYSFVLGLPAPSEKQVWQQIEAEMDFIREIKQINPFTEIIIYIYSPVPTEGSELFGDAKERGFRYPQQLDEWLRPEWLNFDIHREHRTPWLTSSMVRRIHEFETVLHAQYPTISDHKLTVFQRSAMRSLSSVRYKRNLLRYPYELKLLQRFWLRYRRPEKEGF
jgi:anaerobic magnesium-protoporphyrin IX monomethyl ester cyclase